MKTAIQNDKCMIRPLRCDEQQCFLAQKIMRSLQNNANSIILVYQWKLLLFYGMFVVCMFDAP